MWVRIPPQVRFEKWTHGAAVSVLARHASGRWFESNWVHALVVHRLGRDAYNIVKVVQLHPGVRE